MRLCLWNSNLYANQVHFCHAQAPAGTTLAPGRHPVEVRYSHALSRDLPYVEGIGWMGGDAQCDIVLGRVKGRDGVVPCHISESRLAAALDAYLEQGEKVFLEVTHG